MKRGGKWLVCMLGSLALSAAGAESTDAPDHPYQEIVNRNVFSLKPPPPPPSPEDTKPPPSKITLTGITTIVGKKALMKTPPPPGGKPGDPKTDQYYMLGVGEREGEIEVLAIDEKAGSVKVLNSGVEVTLTFEKDGVKVPTTPVAAAAGIPGALPMPGSVIPPPAMPNTINPAGGIRPEFPVRPMRSPVQPGVGNTGAAGVQPTGYSGGVSLPGFTTASPVQSAPVPQNTMSLEEQIIGIETQRKLTENQVLAGRLPPLPTTVLTPQGSPGAVTTAPTENQSTSDRTLTFPPLPGRVALPPTPAGR